MPLAGRTTLIRRPEGRFRQAMGGACRRRVGKEPLAARIMAKKLEQTMRTQQRHHWLGKELRAKERVQMAKGRDWMHKERLQMVKERTLLAKERTLLAKAKKPKEKAKVQRVKEKVQMGKERLWMEKEKVRMAKTVLQRRIRPGPTQPTRRGRGRRRRPGDGQGAAGGSCGPDAEASASAAVRTVEQERPTCSTVCTLVGAHG